MLNLLLWYFGLITYKVEINHLAIIMDGNRRWTKKWYRRLLGSIPQLIGHQQGANNAEVITRLSAKLGVKFLTLYAFSTENWSRSQAEIDYLMDLFRKNFKKFFETLIKENVQIQFIGRRDRLPSDIVKMMGELEQASAENTGVIVTIALDYGGDDEHERALQETAKAVLTFGSTEQALSVYSETLDSAKLPEVDLLIRTSGEQRISNFLLRRISYAEILFIKACWPDFRKWQLYRSLWWYSRRVRTRGGDRPK